MILVIGKYLGITGGAGFQCFVRVVRALGHGLAL